MDLKQFFETMETIHFVFGLPCQWNSLESTVEGVICE
jgi:hypothetical protein